MSLRRLCADGSLQDSSAIEAPPSLAITRTNPEGAVGLASICDRVVTVVYTATPWNSTLLSIIVWRIDFWQRTDQKVQLDYHTRHCLHRVGRSNMIYLPHRLSTYTQTQWQAWGYLPCASLGQFEETGKWWQCDILLNFTRTKKRVPQNDTCVRVLAGGQTFICKVWTAWA